MPLRQRDRRLLCILMLLISLIAFVPVTPVAAQETAVDQDSSAASWIVHLRQDPALGPMWEEFWQTVGDADIVRLFDHLGMYAVRFDGTTPASEAILQLMANSDVVHVEPDLVYHYQFEPNDPQYPEQHWARTVRLPDAWSISSGRTETVVAVLDSGVRADHPDLKGKVLPGHDFLDDDNDPADNVGHGTAVAGIIAARGNDGVGIAGTAMDVNILPVRIGDADGAPVSTIAQGIQYAVDQGAAVINLSLGSTTPSATLEKAIQYAADNNVAVVASAGNEPDQAYFPASYQRVISVGATTLDGQSLANFTSRITRVDVSAPGVDVMASYWTPEAGNTWSTVSGTSFSTPIVAGEVALLESVNPDLSLEQLRSILTSTAQQTFESNTPGGGAGLLDAAAALEQAMTPTLARTWEPSDQPVAIGATSRTWTWGPHAFQVMTEPYAESPHGQRLVAYYDKSRMEITNPLGDRQSPWYVTNGLLVSEMVTGRVQIGDQQYEDRAPAEIPVAGDPDDSNGPSYASFTQWLDGEPLSEGEVIAHWINRDGQVSVDPRYGQYGVTAAAYIAATNHRVASIFWDYLRSTGLIYHNGEYQEGPLFEPLFYATGYPIIEAYWSQVKVAGEMRDVLIQCFERRCLTYAPSNPEGWKVEMGNVGQHYYRWRYDKWPTGPSAQDPAALAQS